jgi:hypothetical protein
VRAAHSYGVHNYEFFTLAHDHAQLVLDYALRERFVEFYSGVATFMDQSGTKQRLTFSTFDELHRQLRERGRPRGQRRWRLQVRRTSQTMVFDGMLTALLEWACAHSMMRRRFVLSAPGAWRPHGKRSEDGFTLQAGLWMAVASAEQVSVRRRSRPRAGFSPF